MTGEQRSSGWYAGSDRNSYIPSVDAPRQRPGGRFRPTPADTGFEHALGDDSLVPPGSEAMTGSPHRLRVNHLERPLGLLQRPLLSWALPAGTTTQKAYRIRTAGGWDSGMVRSSEHLFIAYGGPALHSGERVEWQVMVWTDAGASDWSRTGQFEAGLLQPEDWQAHWITPSDLIPAPAGERPAQLIRSEFTVDREVLSARLHVTAHGLYEGFLNSARIGDDELTPGFTQYRERLQVQTYDVTASLQPGRNSIAFLLADGWYRGQIGYFRAHDQWGTELSLLAQLVIDHQDGPSTVIGTGEGWRSTVGHITAADLIAGEQWDLRRLPRGWAECGFDDSQWHDVAVGDIDVSRLVDSPAPAVRRVQEIRPISVTRLDKDRQIVNLGQNINGWTRLSRLGPPGTTVRLVHGEWLDAEGDVLTHNIAPDYPELRPAGQVDAVISAGHPGDVFEPRRTTHGFQYVRVEGHPENLTVDDVTGVMVHTDMQRTGWFECSDERLNKLHEATVWSLRGNSCDIPTDCPHRERVGWTGDWQLFISTGAFLYDVAGFSKKWLRDVAADQTSDGTVLHFSPMAPYDAEQSPVRVFSGSAGWGDACVIVPWALYSAYGDRAVLEESWPMIASWLGRIERIARNKRHPERALLRPSPLPHERYLWDGSSHWGEWLEPGQEIVDLDEHAQRDQGHLATAYYAHSAGLAARIAEVLGKSVESEYYRGLESGAREAWQKEYIGRDGFLTPDTQANHVRALAFDLVPAAIRARTVQRLVELVRESENHLATGFLATPFLLPVLAEAGHLDLAYSLLLRDTEPSWLVMIDRGANTIWENWNGITADGEVNASLNHYSKGAVVSFLHRYVAGLAPLEGEVAWRRFRVRPRPGGNVQWARALHDSPYGLIECEWRLSGDQLHLKVVVPPGTEALITMPSGVEQVAGPGRHVFTD